MDSPWSTSMLHEIAEYIERLADGPLDETDRRFIQRLVNVFWSEYTYPVSIREQKWRESAKGFESEMKEIQIEPHSNC